MFVKVCGITREDDALLAVAMGADAVGFNFAPSKRQIAPTLARDIARRLPAEVLTVGIFRDESPDRVVDIVHHAGLKAAQLHGNESPEVCREVRSRIPRLIKAFSAGSAAVERADEYGADVIMLDAAEGGSGETFDWSLTARAPRSLPLILAGGLTPENVAEAIGTVKPWGVDVATGVEDPDGEPGQKDARKVRAFVRAAKEAGGALGHDPVEVVELGPYDWVEET